MRDTFDHLFDDHKFCGKWCMHKKNSYHEKRNNIPRTRTTVRKSTATTNKRTETHPPPSFDEVDKTIIFMK